MYKILLADDEPEVLEGLKIVIDWNKYGFEIADTAVNGREALEKLKSGKFHLVVTDIRMPVLDGLELLKALQNINPSIKILILSGFNEFKYAKKAIELGVKGYLLKPVDQDELIGYLKGINLDLDNEINNKITIREYGKMARDKFLLNLANGSLSCKEIEEQAAEYRINFNYNQYCIAIMEIEDFYTMAINNIEDANLIKFAVRNITEEIISSSCTGYVYDDLQGLLGIIFCGNTLTNNMIKSCITRISRYVTPIFNLTITVGVGNICSNMADIRISKEQAQKALERKYFVENNGIIYYSNLEMNQDLVWQLNWDFMPLLAAIEVMNINIVNEEIRNIIIEADRKLISRELIQSFSLSLASGLSSIVRKYKGDVEKIFDGQKLDILTMGCSSMEEFRIWLTDMCEKVVNYISELSGIKTVQLIDQIKKHIDDHYSEDISLKTIAAVFYLNTAYLGQLIKNTLGESFSDYLNKKRIEEVKKMILIDGFKAYDAVKKVGYNNPEYFYRQFKRYEVISFAEYKEKIKGSIGGGSF